MKYHYYIGIQLPEPLRQQVIDIQSRLFEPIDSIDPLEPHITLLPPPILGDIDPENLTLHVKAAAMANLPFEVALTDVISFNGRAVAFKAESQTLYELQQQLVALLPFEHRQDVEYYPEPKFTPHITIVQAIRGHTLPSKLIDTYTAAAKEILPATFKVEHLTLFEWEKPRKYVAKPI
jgi:2'-5' RNA ligase